MTILMIDKKMIPKKGLIRKQKHTEKLSAYNFIGLTVFVSKNSIKHIAVYGQARTLV